MTGRQAHPRSAGGAGRLQALADGFFAVAMTLLVLDLSAGRSGVPVTVVLRGELPHLLLYFDSMLVLGALWFGHRNAFEYVRRTDHPHTWLTLAIGIAWLSTWAAIAVIIALPLLPVSGISYRVQYRLSHGRT